MTDGELVIELHNIARKHNSEFLRAVADRLSELVKKEKQNGYDS